MRYLVLLLMTTLVCSNMQAQNNANSRLFGQEYFPVKENVTYIYDSDLGEIEAEYSVNDFGLVISFDASIAVYTQTYQIDSSGIYTIQTISEAFGFSKEVYYNEPLPRTPLPMRIGDEWEWEGYEIIDGEFSGISVKGAAIGIDTIETGIGNLECLKIEYSMTLEKGTVIKLREWLAEDIGTAALYIVIEQAGIAGFLENILGLDELTLRLNSIEQED